MDGIRTESEACRFMKSVKFALRYGATPGLPLPSIYSAAGDKRLAIELTNALLARGEAIETNVLAGRLVLAHRDVVPALYALRTRFRAARLSHDAKRALELIRSEPGGIPLSRIREGASGADRGGEQAVHPQGHDRRARAAAGRAPAKARLDAPPLPARGRARPRLSAARPTSCERLSR
jgi:hypothetical protein